jgi:L-alanine-DL-glutamate epimerase-like enolase superfamily enzyme
MVDVQYMWEDAATAMETVGQWREFDLYFLETPIWFDNLDEYARLHDAAPMKIASGEWLATHWEFEDLIERRKIDVAHPDVGWVGGFLEPSGCANSRLRAIGSSCRIAGRPGCP